MEIINYDGWERRTHYQFFRRMDYAHYSISANLDITQFRHKTKMQKLPFYYAMIYAAVHAMNRTEAFRYRIRGDAVILHDCIQPAFTDLSPGSDLFKMVTVEMREDVTGFVQAACEKASEQTRYFVAEELSGRDDLVYITCIPRVSFTHISHTISLNKEDSVPRLAWGKYFPQDGRLLLPFSVQAHHSFVDGIHMGQYLSCLQDELDQF